MPSEHTTIGVGTTDGGQPFTLPIEDILTGRGAIMGKSGSGKSNSASVVLEKLLDGGYGCLVVDVDGEYYGLKEEYELLHAGATEACEIQVGPEHAEKLASLALEQHVPIVLDVSGYIDEGGPGEQSHEARELVRKTAEALFRLEHDLEQPFLLVVEEIHEFVPEGGGLDAVGQQLVQIAKRGRKRGLGLVGISQRPADVKKDVITQADWIVWHRVTWDNDTKEVRRVLGTDYEDPVQHLDDGEAFAMLDWEDTILRVQFQRKQTFDAGATPGLEDVERPDLKGIDDDLVEELSEISDREAKRQDEIDRLEAKLAKKDEEIAELEQDLKQARDVSNAAQQFAAAVQGDNGDGVPEDFEEQIAEKNDRIAELERELEERDERLDQLETELERARVNRDRVQEAERVEERFDAIAEHVGSLAEELDVDADVSAPQPSAGGGEDVEDFRERVEQLEAENDRLRAQADAEISEQLESYEDFLSVDAVQREVELAKQDATCSPRYVKGVLAGIIAESGPVTYDAIAERLGVSTTSDVSKAASELERRKIVTKEREENGMTVDLNVDGIEQVRQAAAEREETEALMEEL